jgi:NADH-quinone oxidoreductase subunit L
MDLTKLLTAILLLPLGSAVLIALFLRRQGKLAALLSVTVGFLIMALSLDVLLSWNGQDFHASIEWLRFGDYAFSMGYYFNHQTALMLLVVSFVASWIQLFSVGYMDDDDAKGRFFGGLSIFMFSILGIVLADNLVMLFVFWELVGFSSYMLIAHYYKTDFANMASKKAFIVNRVGDFGFLLGIVWCWNHYGTVSLIELQSKLAGHADLLGTHRGIAISLLLMCGFIGKSAQFPLQVWLTDAMAGPTPVSALIHAATMVAAGIYFLARVFFLLSPFTLHWIMWSGAAMTAFAGLCALGQTDIKKTLAYSTLSHLGYMACAVGLGYPQLAMFHLAMHACFKATLFLGSGSVIHACHHEQDIYKMGGLWKKMPLTGLTFLLASLANCAIPLFSGAYSKDSIITAAFLKAHQDGAVFLGVYFLVLFGALCTALYTGRLFAVVFLGTPRSEEASQAHESSPFMTVPLIVLGLLSLGGGWVVYGWTWGGHFTGLLPSTCAMVFLQSFNELHEAIEKTGLASILEVINVGIVLVGLVAAYLFYGRAPAGDALAAKSPGAFHILERHGWFDDVYDWYVAQVQQPVCDLVAAIDLLAFKLTLGWGSGGLAGLAGSVLRRLQVGSIHAYVYWFLAGVILFWALAIR